MRIYLLPVNEVTRRLYGHWAFERGHSIAEEILPGMVNASSPERLERMNRVAESAAAVVMDNITPHDLTVRAGSSLQVHGHLGEALLRRVQQASAAGAPDTDYAVELMALNYHLDQGGFNQINGHKPEEAESLARIAKAFPAYGEAA